MGSPSIRISEIPSDFLPVMVRDADMVVCYGHQGVAVDLGFQLTDDPGENHKRAERLRHTIWWHLEMVRRGIDPDQGGMA